MAFFKISSSCACRRLTAHSWRNSAAVAGSNSAPRAAATGVSASFCHFIEAFGIDAQGTRRGLGRATFTGQAQGFSPEGGIVAPAFARLGAGFHDIRKIRPYSIHIDPTTSALYCAR